MTVTTLETDVVVAGTGVAGLVSTVRAQEYGADVIVLEKGNRIGGTTTLSGGYIQSYDDHEASDLSTSEPLEEGLDWLSKKGVEFKEKVDDDYAGSGRSVDSEEFVDHMSNKIRKSGGEILLKTPLCSLITNDRLAVTGVQARHPDGTRVDIQSNSVILATGGFQGNERLVEEFITENTDDLYLRSNPWSTGDGLLAALDIGAKTTRGFSQFDGHNMPAPPAKFNASDFSDVSQYYGPWGIAIDQQGKRFTDESRDPLESPLLMDVVKKANGRAYLVVDSRVYDSEIVFDRNPGDMISKAEEIGGEVVRSDNLLQFGEDLSDIGVDGDKTVETIANFNQGVKNGNNEKLNPPRMTYRSPIDTPPFYAVAVQPGIHFTMGGLDVNEKSQVLLQAATSSSLAGTPTPSEEISEQPIQGLYATGVDVGNPDRTYYIGGWAQGIATGRAAGKHAAIGNEGSNQ